MKGILRYLRDYKKESVLAPLFKMLEACFELLIPIVMAHIIDTGIKNQDMGYVLRMCLVMIALGIIGLSCSLTAQYFSAKAATGFERHFEVICSVISQVFLIMRSIRSEHRHCLLE